MSFAPGFLRTRKTTIWPETLLLDLDGTLTDPKEGITKCIQFALEKLGHPVPETSELLWCIGPPLQTSFARMLPDPRQVNEAVELFRDRFRERGMFENFPYEGIRPALAELSAKGRKLYVATSKPAVFAREILNHFALAGYFTRVFGSELDGRLSDKGDLIGHILKELGLAGAEAVMIGDREHDIIGAQKNGLSSIGVSYGYGSREELERAGATRVVSSPAELARLVGSPFRRAD